MYKSVTLPLILFNIFVCGVVFITFVQITNSFVTHNSSDEVQSQQFLIRKIRQIKYCTPPTGGYGICVKWGLCQIAQIEYYQKNIVPKYCDYSPFNPIVCCDVTSNNAIVRNQRISEQDCKEWYAPMAPRDPGYPRIGFGFGGVRTLSGEFTHMAALGWKNDLQKNDTERDNYNFWCGGTLISDYFVLSAAHCASINGIRPKIARIGGENLFSSYYDANIPITNIYVHPQYRRRQVYNDIALMELKMLSYHKPACLWQTQDTQYINVIALGYGDTSFGGIGSDDLLRLDLSIYPKQECQLYYPPQYRIQNGIIDSHICAGHRKNLQDTCQGDSGGPLMVKVNSAVAIVPYILGVTSFGHACGTGPPSVYTKVSSYLDWIESIVWPS